MQIQVGKDRVFLGLAGLLLGNALGLGPREIPWSSPAGPQKTSSNPPLLLGLTHSRCIVFSKYVRSDLLSDNRS